MFLAIGHDRVLRRLVQLLVGLVLFGFSIGLLARSGLGLPPWDVMHQGLAHQFGLTIGIWSVIVSVLILILWLPLREPFGLGTLLNAIIVGLTVDVTMWLVPETDLAVVAWGMVAAAVALNGVASGMYIGAGMGPGPRDGLMTAIARRGPSIRFTRTSIEVVVLITGILLGGTFGFGTVIYALAIGPVVQFFLPRWAISPQI